MPYLIQFLCSSSLPREPLNLVKASRQLAWLIQTLTSTRLWLEARKVLYSCGILTVANWYTSLKAGGNYASIGQSFNSIHVLFECCTWVLFDEIATALWFRKSSINCIEPSPALDVVGLGLGDGYVKQINLYGNPQVNYCPSKKIGILSSTHANKSDLIMNGMVSGEQSSIIWDMMKRLLLSRMPLEQECIYSRNLMKQLKALAAH